MCFQFQRTDVVASHGGAQEREWRGEWHSEVDGDDSEDHLAEGVSLSRVDTMKIPLGYA